MELSEQGVRKHAACGCQGGGWWVSGRGSERLEFGVEWKVAGTCNGYTLQGTCNGYTLQGTCNTPRDVQ